MNKVDDLITFFVSEQTKTSSSDQMPLDIKRRMHEAEKQAIAKAFSEGKILSAKERKAIRQNFLHEEEESAKSIKRLMKLNAASVHKSSDEREKIHSELLARLMPLRTRHTPKPKQPEQPNLSRTISQKEGDAAAGIASKRKAPNLTGNLGGWGGRISREADEPPPLAPKPPDEPKSIGQGFSTSLSSQDNDLAKASGRNRSAVSSLYLRSTSAPRDRLSRIARRGRDRQHESLVSPVEYVSRLNEIVQAVRTADPRKDKSIKVAKIARGNEPTSVGDLTNKEDPRRAFMALFHQKNTR